MPGGFLFAPWQMGAGELAAAFRRGELSPIDALASCLERIETLNPCLNAFVALRRDAALEDARRSAERHARGEALGPLDGVPVAVKDNLPTADLPTTWGNVAMRDHRPAHDELAVARLRAAGAVIVGKTNVPEFTLEGYTSNRLFGTTRNPWNPALTPGGSSGGSVAAVAAGMVPLALGTDGGGSTRRPASHTGLVGLKPSIGAIAREHALPPLLLDFEVVGPIARSVADVRALFGALRGPHRADRSSWAAEAARRPLPAALRVRYVATLDGAPVDPQIARQCRNAAHRLAELGHAVDEGPLPLDLREISAAWPQVGAIGLAALAEREPAWIEGASPRYRELAEAGARLPASRLWAIVEAAQQLRRDAAKVFDDIDLLAMPAAAALPWPADEAFPTHIDGREVGPRGHAVFTGWVNAAGLPAVSIPCLPSAEGLPIGLQLIADFGCDDALLDLAQAVEAHGRRDWRFP